MDKFYQDISASGGTIRTHELREPRAYYGINKSIKSGDVIRIKNGVYMLPEELAMEPAAGIRRYCRRLAQIYKSEEAIGGLPSYLLQCGGQTILIRQLFGYEQFVKAISRMME